MTFSWSKNHSIIRHSHQYKCDKCGKTYIKGALICMVLHLDNQCCHYGDEEVKTQPVSRRSFLFMLPGIFTLPKLIQEVPKQILKVDYATPFKEYTSGITLHQPFAASGYFLHREDIDLTIQRVLKIHDKYLWDGHGFYDGYKKFTDPHLDPKRLPK